MSEISLDVFEKSSLDSTKTGLSEKLVSLHKDFESSVEPINGYFGYLAATVADNLPRWSQNMLDRINSPEEASIYKKAGLKGGELNGREVLTREIDLNHVDADGISNMQRMERGLAPIGTDEKPVELHHIGQKADAPLAELTAKEHRGETNSKILSDNTKESEIDRNAFAKERKEHWKARAENLKERMSFKGQMSAAHAFGVKSGLTAAGLTLAISTVDNVRGVMAGDITAKDAFADVAADTGTAGAIGYGTTFVSSAIAGVMSKSASPLFQSLGKANVPATAITFGIKSCNSVVKYAQGEMSGENLAVDLGKNAAGIGGSIAGSAFAGAALGSVVPGAGTAAGFAAGLVGGTVGYAVATGAYATAIEVAKGGIDVLVDKAEGIANSAADAYSTVSAAAADGANAIGNVANDVASGAADTYAVVSAAVVENANVLKDKAVEMGQSVIDMVASTVPEAVEDVRTAMNDFAANLGAAIRL
jgi:hypothetical protein